MSGPKHTLYTPEQVATSMIAALRFKSTLARLITLDFSKEFANGRGSTVDVRRPKILDPARKRTKTQQDNEEKLLYSTLTQGWVPVTLEDQIYNALKLPDHFHTFNLEQLEEEVIAPMGESVAEALNVLVVETMKTTKAGLTDADQAAKGKYVGENGTAYDSIDALHAAKTKFAAFGVGATVKASELNPTNIEDVLPAITAAHQLMGQRGVPLGSRSLAIGADWERVLLDHPQLLKANESGSTGALREAMIGRLKAFNVVVDYNLDPREAYAFDRQAVVLSTRAPKIPLGAAFAKHIHMGGFAMRWLQDYDSDITTDRALVDTFAGASVLDPQRIVKLTGKATMTQPKSASGA